MLPVSLLDPVSNGYNVAHLIDPTIAPYQAQESLHFAVSLWGCHAVGVNGGRLFAYVYYFRAVGPQLEYSEMCQTQQSPRPLLIKGGKLITVSNES
ncbi:TPA: hypothetical protein PJN01_004855 [Escherichia coli]|nr:hypothetical protein [Escherichia coli]